MSGGAETVMTTALRLMPMHLHLDSDRRILSAGTTLRHLIGEAAQFDAAFEPAGPEGLAGAGATGRVFLRLLGDDGIMLRGQAVPDGQGGTLLNLGFGIGVVEAIRRFGLTDRDFAPSELVMEVLFLTEANNVMTDELTRANLRLEEARSKAEAEAFTDPLTGLSNRRGLELAFEALRRAAVADPERQFAVLVLDLDRFKALNDSMGHAAGDAMLRAVAQRLRVVTRDEDTIARTGGDEFVLLIPGLADVRQLEALGARICAAITRPVPIGGTVQSLSASVGAVLSRDCPTLDWTALEAAADEALYAAKRDGRGCLRVAR